MSRATGSCREQVRDLFTNVTDGKPFVIRPASGRSDGIEATTVNIMTVCGRQAFPLRELVVDSSLRGSRTTSNSIRRAFERPKTHHLRRRRRASCIRVRKQRAASPRTSCSHHRHRLDPSPTPYPGRAIRKLRRVYPTKECIRPTPNGVRLRRTPLRDRRHLTSVAFPFINTCLGIQRTPE